MTPTRPTATEARCRAIVAAAWSHSDVRVGATVAGEGAIEVWATVPPLRGMTCRVIAIGTTSAPPWRRLLSKLRREARKEVDAHESRAASRANEALHHRRVAADLRALIYGETTDA